MYLNECQKNKNDTINNNDDNNMNNNKNNSNSNNNKQPISTRWFSAESTTAHISSRN